MNFSKPTRDNYSNYNKEKNKYFSNKLDKRSVSATPKEYIVKKDEFPTLCDRIEYKTPVPTQLEYAKMTSKEIQKVNPNYDALFGILQPGRLYLSYDKQTRKIISKEGPKTDYAIKMAKQAKLENDLNYRMNKAIREIDERRLQYIKYYEYMNGDGSYEDYFRIQQHMIDDAVDEEYDDVNEFSDDEFV